MNTIFRGNGMRVLPPEPKQPSIWSGYNPSGLVWLFQEFQNADSEQLPQLLSDHPANGSRIQTLETHFRDKPFVFSKFNPDPKSATPFSLPKDASSMQFLRP